MKLRLARSMVAGTLLLASLGVLASPNEAYREGVDAFRSHQYDVALSRFLAARAGGLDAPGLDYNIGVTYFRLGRLQESYDAFARIAGHPEWGALANYNMGLIEERRGRIASARRHFRIAEARADSPQLRALAASRLTASTPGDVSADLHRWIGTFALGSGYDDNVLLTDDDAQLGFADAADYFVEVLGTAGRFIAGGRENGWRLDLGAYYRAHADLDDFNLGVGSGALAHHRTLGAWQLRIGAKIDLQLAGKSLFATVPGLRAQATRELGTVRLRIRNDLNRVGGGSDFEHLTGWQNRAAVETSVPSGHSLLRAGYELELNGRDDFRIGTEFASFSPSRHRVYVSAATALAERVELDLAAEFRASRYPDATVLIRSEAVVVEPKRREDRLTGTARIGYRPAAAWAAFAEYQYTDQDSNIPRFRYVNHLVMLGLERAF
jgi:tetratricopeptide (TPR) repeat protein